MRAAVVRRYGPPSNVEIVDLPTPTPGPRDVLVRVEAAAVTSGDARMRAARFPPGFAPLARPAIGLLGPRRRVLGMCLAGTVEAVGAHAPGLAPGDRVAGMTGPRLGAHAELAVVRGSRLVRVPDGVGDAAAAAALFGGSTALHFLRDRARVAPGERVLVNGASGAVGTSAVQLAKRLGAHVTGIASTGNLALVARLGADETVDYRRTPVASLQERFDVVLDAVGNVSRAEGLALLRPGGRLVLAVAGLADTALARGPVLAGPAAERPEAFAHLLDLLATGELDPVVEAAGGLDGIRAAYERVDSGRKTGNLVIEPGR